MYMTEIPTPRKSNHTHTHRSHRNNREKRHQIMYIQFPYLSVCIFHWNLPKESPLQHQTSVTTKASLQSTWTGTCCKGHKFECDSIPMEWRQSEVLPVLN